MLDTERELLISALWRYVSGDSCDCDCGSGEQWDEIVPCGIEDCPTASAPCHYCEGWGVLAALGVAVGNDMLTPTGRHTFSEQTRAELALRAARQAPAQAALPLPDPLPHPAAWAIADKDTLLRELGEL